MFCRENALVYPSHNLNISSGPEALIHSRNYKKFYLKTRSREQECYILKTHLDLHYPQKHPHIKQKITPISTLNGKDGGQTTVTVITSQQLSCTEQTLPVSFNLHILPVSFNLHILPVSFNRHILPVSSNAVKPLFKNSTAVVAALAVWKPYVMQCSQVNQLDSTKMRKYDMTCA